MPSKRSFFNKALFCKNLSRFWPLWGGVSLAGSLLPLYVLLALLSGAGHSLDAQDFSYALYGVAYMAGPVLSMLYAVLCAMLVWGYLYNPRSAGLMHTLPVDRTCLFVTNTLSGLAMMLIPYAIVGAFICLLAVLWGFFDLIAVANTVLAILLMTVTFFGLGTFCAMLTGNTFALPVLYFLINFLAPLLETLITSLAGQFLICQPGRDGMLDFLSPVLHFYHRLSIDEIRSPGGGIADYCLHGFDTLAVYGLAGLLLLVLAWLLYRARHSESAGDIAAFRVLRPVFRYGLALLSALTVGRMVYELLWGALFQPGLYAQAVPMAICMALTGVLGYYVASMLLEKALRVFRGSWRGVVAVCVGAVLLCAAVSMDLFGVDRRVPALDDVERVSLSDYRSTLSYSAASDPELSQRLLDIHQAVVEDRDYLRSIPSSDGEYHYFTFSYRLKSGGTLVRSYHLWFTQERAADPGTYDEKMAALFADPAIILSKIAIPEGGTLTDVMTYNYRTGYGVEHMDLLDCRQLYEAMLQDAQEGNIPGRDLLRDGASSYDFYLEIEYRLLDEDGSYSHNYSTVYLYPSMEHTIAALLELDCLSQEALDQWDQDLSMGGGEVRVP